MATILFTATGDEGEDRRIRRAYAAGKLQRLAQGVYLEGDDEPIEATVLRSWTKIAGSLVPDGVVTDRSGIEARPWRNRSSGAPKGDAILFMSAPRSRATIKLPGLTINVRQGVGPVTGRASMSLGGDAYAAHLTSVGLRLDDCRPDEGGNNYYDAVKPI